MGRHALRIIVVGGGIAGLAAAICLSRNGHRVTVIEAAAQLNEVGAGIQIPPNSSRILASYGLAERFLEKIVRPRNIQFRRYCDGEILSSAPFRGVLERKYGFPYEMYLALIHRLLLLISFSIDTGLFTVLTTRISSLTLQGSLAREFCSILKSNMWMTERQQSSWLMAKDWRQI